MHQQWTLQVQSSVCSTTPSSLRSMGERKETRQKAAGGKIQPSFFSVVANESFTIFRDFRKRKKHTTSIISSSKTSAVHNHLFSLQYIPWTSKKAIVVSAWHDVGGAKKMATTRLVCPGHTLFLVDSSSNTTPSGLFLSITSGRPSPSSSQASISSRSRIRISKKETHME